MSYWICCNSCFSSPSRERKLAITSCGHVVCSVCYQRDQPGTCLICKNQCQLSPLSDKSSPDVKALFSDINTVATKHLNEMSKVIMFQRKHQTRLWNHYQQRNEKLEEVLVKMKQEMQQMSKKLNDQSAYIAKLENDLQHQSAKASSLSQMSLSSHTPHGNKPVHRIHYNSPISLSRHTSATNISEKTEVDERSLFRKPSSGQRLTLTNPQDGRTGSISNKVFNPGLPGAHCANPATLSRVQRTPVIPDSFSCSSVWKSPIFQPPPSFRQSMSSLVFSPP